MYRYILLIPVLFWMDQRTKKKALTALCDEDEHEILGGRIVLTLHKNPGAMLGFLKNHPFILMFLNVSFVFLSFVYFLKLVLQEGKTLWKWAFVFIIGGGLGNLWDRIQRGYVVDFFRFKKRHIVYNLADFFIFIGSFLGIVAECFGKK
ncbi:MAG: signal peptidase II [Epulopiscium sp.]|nr:signal peptidase II [Candidatus Epulonipiscium sp.]